jgi:LytTr DNA-binding domain
MKSLIQFTAPASVQRRWGEWLRPRDEPSPKGTDGGTAQSGGETQLSARTVYLVGILLIVFSAVVSTFSSARDITWRLTTPQNLWEPALWEATGNIVAIALLPLACYAAGLISSGRQRPVGLAFALVALALTFSCLHFVGMGYLREWAYGVLGYTFKFPWTRQIPYELRKELFGFTAFVVVFWLGQRAMAQQAIASREAPPDVAPAADSQIWLRDGRISVLVDASDIVSVSSAGNYVEYQLTSGRNHLVRATLQSQEARLAALGVVRVHRSRLVNLKRVVALEGRPSGDFEIRLDTGEVIAGSRRFKSAVASITAG